MERDVHSPRDSAIMRDSNIGSPAARVAAVDLARGLAMAFMVAVHALEMYATPPVARSAFGVVIEYLGGPPAAPVFMFLMGVSMTFSSRSSLQKGMRRGIELILLGYLLNSLRGSLPAYLGLCMGRVTLEKIAPWTPSYEFSAVDILQFAGVALILVSLLRLVIRNPWQWICLSVLVTVISPLLWGHMTGIALLDFPLTLLWGADGEHVAFPAFPWLAYVFAGIPFGHWLKAADGRATALGRGALAGIGLLAAGTLVTLTNPAFHMGDYWRSGPGSVVWITGFVLVWLWLCHMAVRRLEPTRFFELMAFWSRNVTVFYFIHWVILGWSTLLVGYHTCGYLTTILLTIAVAALADQSTRLWRRLRSPRTASH